MGSLNKEQKQILFTLLIQTKMTRAMQEVENGFLISGENQRLLSEFMNREFPLRIDWNTMMPVVEKIESYDYVTDIEKDDGLHFCEISVQDLKDEGKIICGHKGSTKFEAVYEACIKFITWFNLKQK